METTYLCQKLPVTNKDMKIANLITILSLGALIVSSCKPHKESREQITQALEEVRAQMPISVVPGTSMLWVDAYLDDDNDFVVFIYQANAEDAMTYFLPQENMNDERYIASVINGMDIAGEDFCDLLIEAEVGLKALIFDSQSGDQLRTMSITPQQLAETLEKIDSGDLQPYDIVDILHMEIAAMEFPQQIDEITWLTNAYVDGTSVVYEAMVDLQVDPNDLTAEDIQESKEEIVESLAQIPLFQTQYIKENFAEENIHFVYMFRDNRGTEFMRHDIAPGDIWPE